METLLDVELDRLVKQSLKDYKRIVLYNDDVNTFDHVIATLVATCDHSIQQAEQCAFLVHYKGKCEIKEGFFDEIMPIYESLNESKLTVKIE